MIFHSIIFVFSYIRIRIYNNAVIFARFIFADRISVQSHSFLNSA